MVDYDKIITELRQEISECNFRYGGTIPAYYQQELRETIIELIKCKESLKDLQKP